jgi:putative ABC transport system ATP-binding protein
MSGPILEARQVSKRLGSGAAEVHALKDVNLALKGGELTLLMGPSGSGKTTLLSILGCMLTPTSGNVYICGKPTEGSNAEELACIRREHIGFIFQSYHLFPTLTAAENVQLALDLRGEDGDGARRRAHDALARVGLAHKIGSYPREMSGGEQQRVAIARAIVSNPSAILADEPTAALDTENGQAVMAILADIAKEPGRGVLVVTHDTRLIPFAECIHTIEDGRIVREDRPQQRKPDLLAAVSGAE